MTKLLEKAVAQARVLSEAEQDAIAQIVIDEIESERRWDEVLARSPEKLRKLADRAWAEHESGEIGCPIIMGTHEREGRRRR